MTHQRRAGAQTQHAIELEAQTVAATFDTSQNNFAPGGSASWARATYVPLDPDDELGTGIPLRITGFEAPTIPVPNDFVLTKIVHNTRSDKQVVLADQDVLSTAGNRMRLGTDLWMAGDAYWLIRYNLESLRWDVIADTRLQDPPLVSTISDSDSPRLYTRNADGQIILMQVQNSEGGNPDQGGVLGSGIGGGLQTLIGDELAAVLWREGAPTIATNINWQPTLGGGQNTTFLLDESAHTLTIVYPMAPGANGRLRFVQADGSGRAITAITDSGAGSHSAHFAGGSIYAFTVGNGAVDIWDWYTPNGLDIYFSLFGADMQDVMT